MYNPDSHSTICEHCNVGPRRPRGGLVRRTHCSYSSSIRRCLLCGGNIPCACLVQVCRCAPLLFSSSSSCWRLSCTFSPTRAFSSATRVFSSAARVFSSAARVFSSAARVFSSTMTCCSLSSSSSLRFIVRSLPTRSEFSLTLSRNCTLSVNSCCFCSSSFCKAC